MLTERTKQVMHKAIAHHQLTDAQPVPEQQASSPQPTLLFHCSARHHMVGNIPLATWSELSWLRPLPASCAP